MSYWLLQGVNGIFKILFQSPWPVKRDAGVKWDLAEAGIKTGVL